MKVIIKKDNVIVDEKIIVVPFDIDGNGKTTAADARLALRNSVNLEKLNNYQKQAGDISDTDAEMKITAADARLILRASVGLENVKTHFNSFK